MSLSQTCVCVASVCCICYILSTLEVRNFTFSKDCFRVKTFEVGIKIGFRVRGLVGKVRAWVRSWVRHSN